MALEPRRSPWWDVLAQFERLERSRLPLWIWIVLLWAAIVVPAIAIRGFYWEEGTVVGLARGMVEDSHWLAPHLYGMRFVERPVLMSVLVAGLGLMTGSLSEWVTRIPTVLSLLGGALLLFGFVRRYTRPLAALFAAVCFLASPIIVQKVIVAEPDIMVSDILFAAFVVWWTGHETGKLPVSRWMLIGVLLALAALVKGPQPVAYFGLGVGSFTLLRRQWQALSGLALAGGIAALVSAAWYWAIYQPADLTVWAEHARLTQKISVGAYVLNIGRNMVMLGVEMFTPLVLAIPLIVLVLRQRLTEHRDLAVALALYAVCCTLVLMVWPHSRIRYAMPAVLALAALAGLAFERFRPVQPRLTRAALLVAMGVLAYPIGMSWVAMPVRPGLFQRSRLAGRTVASTIAARPAVLYAPAEYMDKNILLYVPQPVRAVPLREILAASPPAWALLSREQEQQLRAARPDLAIELQPVTDKGPVFLLVELRAR